MKKIALIGTHGTGKTTIAYSIAASLKKQGIDSEALREIARLSPLPINENTTKKSQEWIVFNQYIKEIEEEANNVYMLICDRSVLDGYVYYNYQFGDDNTLETFVRDKIETYDFLYKIPISFSKITNDGVRSVNREFQFNIDRHFNYLLDRFDINYKIFNDEQDVIDNLISL